MYSIRSPTFSYLGEKPVLSLYHLINKNIKKMSQAKKIKKMLSQWEQEKIRKVVAVPSENAVKPETSYGKPKMEEYLIKQYDFRFNVLTGLTEYRIKATGEFRALDERERNTLFIELRGKGIKCTFSGLLRFLHSSLIEEFHPFHTYFQMLPAWDGTNRITSLASRISDNPLWINCFHRWMLALTAQWMGIKKLHANSVAPILISTEQGMMKSTFCKSLMPKVLQDYYTDKVDLTTQGFLEHKLALMGIINLDEFDSLSEQRMAQLKNLMQASTVTIRQTYKKNFRQLPRIASFIGTSNRPDLLTDPTGSRRFVCVEVKHKIDCSNMEMDQVYAQLKAELEAGERHWFTSAEEEEIQKHNASFYQIRPEEELLRTHYRAPIDGEEPEMLSLIDILDELKREHAHLFYRCDMKRFGIFLQTIGIEKVHTRHGNQYKVIRI